MSPSSLDDSDQAGLSVVSVPRIDAVDYSAISHFNLDLLTACLQRWVSHCLAATVQPDHPIFSPVTGVYGEWVACFSQILVEEWVAIVLPVGSGETGLTPDTSITVEHLALSGVSQSDKVDGLIRVLQPWLPGAPSDLRVSDLQQLQVNLPGVVWPLSVHGEQADAWLLTCPTTLMDGAVDIPGRSHLIQQGLQDCAIALQQVQQIRHYRERLHQLECENRELSQTSRLKSEFLANTSHEIRTPLSSILGFTHLLKAQGYNPINMRHQEYLDIILASGQHLLALINDILDLSKIEANQLSLNWETLEVAEVCQMALKLVKEKASDKSLKLELELATEIDSLTADPLRLKQMLFNLLSNALKFTKRGSVGLRVSTAEGWMRFAVWDTGVGISEAQQKLLFVPYSQLESPVQVEGTGLGLALTQKLAELHGGWVEIQSTVDRGSCFTIVLPKVTPDLDPETHTALRPGTGVVVGLPPEETVVTPEEASRTTANAQTIELAEPPLQESVLPNRILLVEDHPNNAKLLLTYLSKLGYEVSWAKHAEGMWSELSRAKPTLILMDINLPDVDGLTLTRQLREDAQFAEIPIIAQTAMAMKGDRDLCIEAGATDYISKPIDLDHLARLVNQYVQS